jgi:hypothetical protein
VRDNITPADVYEGRRNEILDQRAMVKARTLTHKKIHNLQLAAGLGKQLAEKSLLKNGPIGPISFANVQRPKNCIEYWTRANPEVEYKGCIGTGIFLIGALGPLVIHLFRV